MHIKIKIGHHCLELGHRKKVKNFELPKEIILPTSLTSIEYEQNQKFVHDMCMQNEVVTPKSCLCFLPYCNNLEAGGIKTVFLMLEALQENCNTELYINVFPPISSSTQQKKYEKIINQKFPNLHFHLVQVNEVKWVDIAICTLWITAFELAKFNRCKQKYYLIQDYETLFYPSGSVAALVDETYKFGFYGMTNSQSLAEKYRQFTNVPIYRYFPGVDKSLYYPADKKSFFKDQYTLIFYGRPSNLRNCFELIALICRQIKAELKNKIRIISVGEDYNPADYELDDIVCNEGRVESMQKLAELYRQCDIGISFITTPTFSYQHLEYMASGLCLVTNEQPGITDFIKNEENALVCPMIVDVIAQRIVELINNPKLMKTLSRNAVKSIQSFEWDDFKKSLCNFIKSKKI